MSIYLYIKRHKVTGLKYFGKTTKSNPHSYPGSGKYWNRHCNEHGKGDAFIETTHVWEFTNQDECTEFALNFSRDNNIVESKEWANLVEENGLDGGDRSAYRVYTPLSESSKQKMTQSKLGKSPWNKGKKIGVGGNKNPRTLEQKEKIRQSVLKTIAAKKSAPHP